MTALPNLLELSNAFAEATSCSTYLRLAIHRLRLRDFGSKLGLGPGSSIEFHDHRPYTFGDDPRHIDWQAFARTEQYTVKLFREEVSPRVDLIIDWSRSMFCYPDKSLRVCQLIFFCIRSAQLLSANINIWIAKEEALLPLETESLTALDLPDLPAKTKNSKEITSTRSITLNSLPARQGILRVLISDLLFADEPSELISALSPASGQGLILAPFSREESDPSWLGASQNRVVRLEDSETTSFRRQQIRKPVLESYQQRYERHFKIWSDAATKGRVSLVRVPSEGPLVSGLQYQAIPCGAVETCS